MQDQKKVDIYNLDPKVCKKYGFKKQNLIKVLDYDKNNKSDKKRL